MTIQRQPGQRVFRAEQAKMHAARHLLMLEASVRAILVVLILTLLAPLGLADVHRVFFNNRTPFSVFKTFVVREGYSTNPRPGEKNRETGLTSDSNPKLAKAIGDAIRLALQSRGLKETQESPDLIVNFSLELRMVDREFAGDFRMGNPPYYVGTLGIDLMIPASNSPVWHGVFYDDEKLLSKLETNLPEDARKLLLEYPPKIKK